MERASEEFLKRLLDIPSPSGFEEEAIRFWTRKMARHADRIEKDVHGNAMAALNEKGSPRVMLAGHIDEIGFMVTHVSDEGFLSFSQLGGHDRQIIQGMRVKIMTAKGPVMGLLGKKPVHLMRGDEGRKVPETSDLWIDIGAKDGKEAKKMVEIGSHAVVDMGFARMPNRLAVARGFDDRIGAFVAAEALRKLRGKRPKAAVFSVATVQEEVGLRGAMTSTFRVRPDVGIAVDVTHAIDYPGVGGKERARGSDNKLGKGPAITRGPNINPKVYSRLVAAAKKRKIPYQVEADAGIPGTDAAVIQISRAGVASGLIGIPNRYMHTPCEVVSLEDVENASSLLAQFILDLSPRTNFIPSD